MTVKAVLLAAGLGTRLRPLTDFLPKCLAPVRGRPLLEYWLRLLLESQVSRVLINTHHHADLVAAYVAGSPWSDRIELSHEPVLLGTGGTLLANARFLGAEPFLVAHADNLTSFDLQALLAAHHARPEGTLITMMTFTTLDPQSCGIVTTDDRGVVNGFFEKTPNPPGNRANAAVYLFEPEVLKFIGSLNRTFVDLSSDVLPRFVGHMATWHNSTYHRDIGTLESLAAGNREFPSIPFTPPSLDPWQSVLARLNAEDRARIDRFMRGTLAGP
jgi:mannose-1-phosphate guanylyltransferase